MKIGLILIMILILLSGCGKEIIYAKQPCMRMNLIQQPEVQSIRVLHEDGALYDAYINEFRGKINNQNKIIKKLNSTCKKWETKAK